MKKIDTKKLEKAVNRMETLSNYVNAEYYHPKFIRLSRLLTELTK